MSEAGHEQKRLSHAVADDPMIPSWQQMPEIPLERQRDLIELLQAPSDLERGTYPFKEVHLQRADLEWLIKYKGSTMTDRTKGLDLRGVDLRNEQLDNLPLRGAK